MITKMPGTTIECDISRTGEVESILTPMFMAGGLVLSQVSQLTGLEPYIIQNWVKRGYVSSPTNKKYSKQQFCRLVIISFLRDTLQLEKITKLLSYINGKLNDESDDLIDDYQLYLYFTSLLVMGDNGFPLLNTMEERIGVMLDGFKEVYSGGKKRLSDVLYIMEVAYSATMLKQEAEQMLAEHII